MIAQPDILRINQEILSCAATCPKVYGKVESFSIRSPDNKTKPKKKRNSFVYDYPPKINTNEAQNIYGFSDPNIVNAGSQHFQYLISAFEESFPDYDFSTVHPWNFKLVQSKEQAQTDMNWKFQSVLPDSDPVVSHIWSFLESQSVLNNCSIYIYESDRPDAFTSMGAVMNMCYFILNEKLNKIILVHLREGTTNCESEYDDMDDDMFDY